MEYLKNILKLVNDSEYVIEDRISELAQAVEEFSTDCSLAILHDKQDDLISALNMARRIQYNIKKNVSGDREEFVYLMGVFSGIFKEVNLLLLPLERKNTFLEIMTCLYQKKHIPEILKFLYANPDARHKDIASAINVNTNQASELLNELVQARCITNTKIGKSSLYALTTDGVRFLKRQLERSQTEPLYQDIEDKVQEYLSESSKYIREKSEGIMGIYECSIRTGKGGSSWCFFGDSISAGKNVRAGFRREDNTRADSTKSREYMSYYNRSHRTKYYNGINKLEENDNMELYDEFMESV